MAWSRNGMYLGVATVKGNVMMYNARERKKTPLVREGESGQQRARRGGRGAAGGGGVEGGDVRNAGLGVEGWGWAPGRARACSGEGDVGIAGCD